jgi:hypothetical protein
MLHHDIRSSLVYCLKCTHEWQVDAVVATIANLHSASAEVPGEGDAAALDSLGDFTHTNAVTHSR